MDEHVKTGIDILAWSGVLAVILGLIPIVSAVLSLVWLGMRIFEGIPTFLDTLENLKKRWKNRRGGSASLD